MRRIAQIAAYETTRELPSLPESALGGRGGAPGRCLRATPSTGSPGADAVFAGRPVRVGSPQGRFADAAALVDGTVLEGAEAWGKHLFIGFTGERFVHVLGLYGKFDVVAGRGVPTPGRRCAWIATGPGMLGTAYADLAARRPASW